MKKKKTLNVRTLSVVLSLLMVISVISLPTLKAKAAAGTLDDFIERCYTVTLDRPSDSEGFDYWKGRVLNGDAVGIEVAYGFLFSKEYTQKDKTNTEYVRDLYTLFMGRDPDDSGFNDWMNKLDEGASRLDVFVGFANSPEFYNICESYGITAGRYVKGYDRNTINNVNLYVERLYKICLGRIGDKGGQTNWAEKLITKQISGSECARSFIFSKEYTNLGLSDEEFVENLYLAMFGRPSDAEGKANWMKVLESGKSRDEVFAGFVNSPEFDNICKTYGINKGDYSAKDISQYKVGDIIKFGKYEQDGDLSNGHEDIEWQILNFKDGKMLVISKYAIDYKQYNTSYEEVTWETCSLRKWLNEDFYNSAFSDDEKNSIPSVTIKNIDNPQFGADGGNDTNDKVFCLGIDEIETYFGDYTYYNVNELYGLNQKLICTPTPYTENKSLETPNPDKLPLTLYLGDDIYESYKENGYTSDIIGRLACDWWTRSTGVDNNYAIMVHDIGLTGNVSAGVDMYFGIRPAMYIEY